MQWRDDTTLPSRGLRLRSTNKSSEGFRITLGLKPLKLRTSKCFRFAPEIGHPICASTSTNYLSIGFAKRSRRPAARRDARRGSSRLGRASAEFPCRRCRHTNARLSGRTYRNGPVFYTFRKSPLLLKARDVTYRQCKSLCIFADCTSVWGIVQG